MKLVYLFPTGNLQKVLNPVGRILRYESDANKLVTHVIQDDKLVFTARFDEFGR